MNLEHFCAKLKRRVLGLYEAENLSDRLAIVFQE